MGKSRLPKVYQPDLTPCALDDHERCTAHSKQTGRRCRQRKYVGRDVCRYHGGKAGRPPIHGRYSQGLQKVRRAYQASLQDQTLWDPTEPLAVLDALTKKRMERCEQLDTPEFRKQALELYTQARDATSPEEAEATLKKLGALLQRGVKEDAAMVQLSEAATTFSRHLKGAWDVKINAASAINARDLMAVLARFADIIEQELGGSVAARIFSRIDAEVLGGSATAKAES